MQNIPRALHGPGLRFPTKKALRPLQARFAFFVETERLRTELGSPERILEDHFHQQHNR
jgi:hypothetical protein